MMTDRVRIEDTGDREMWAELNRVDWSKILHYGTLKLQIRDDIVTLVDKGTTHVRKPRK